ncbi:MAG: tetratricopeptide repeat protein, partial [Bacteroidota bacterium]
TINPEDPVMVSNLGKALYEQEQIKEAIEVFQKSLSLKDDDPDIMNYLGLCYQLDDDTQTAIGYFTKAIELDEGKNATYFDNRAYSKAAKLDYVGAIQDYTTSIDLYSTDPNVFYQRGQLKLRINDKFDACKDFQQAKKLGYEGIDDVLEEHCTTGK